MIIDFIILGMSVTCCIYALYQYRAAKEDYRVYCKQRDTINRMQRKILKLNQDNRMLNILLDKEVFDPNRPT